MAKRTLKSYLLAATAFLVFAGVVYVTTSPIKKRVSAAKAALPPSATQIQVHFEMSGITDYIRLLKAKLPASDFAIFLKNLDISTKFVEQQSFQESAAVNWHAISTTPSWWDPGDELSNSFIDHDGKSESYRLVKYLDGYVYYKGVAW